MADRARRRADNVEAAQLRARPREVLTTEPRPNVPQDVWEDAQRRNNAKMPYTAEFCGDPRPGQSALDRMQAAQ